MASGGPSRDQQTESVGNRSEAALGARQRQPSQGNVGFYRPRSHSPNYSVSSNGTNQLQTRLSGASRVPQQSRSLDERRARISRQRNSSFSHLNDDIDVIPPGNFLGPHQGPFLGHDEVRPPTQHRSSHSSNNLPPPPTITLRRPSTTCLPLEPGLKCSDPLFNQHALALEVTLPPTSSEPRLSPLLSTNNNSSSHSSPHSSSTSIDASSQAGPNDTRINSEERTCFCGFFSEKSFQSEDSPSTGAIRKARRCKFCRSKAKYLPGQRSLDAVSAKIFRRKKTEENRRAASEDRYQEDDSQGPSLGYSSLSLINQSQEIRHERSSTLNTRPTARRPFNSLRRQARMDSDDGLLTNRNTGLELSTIRNHPSDLTTNRSPRYAREMPTANRSPLYSHVAPNPPMTSQNKDLMTNDGSPEGNYQPPHHSNVPDHNLSAPKPPNSLEIPAYFETFPGDIQDYRHLPSQQHQSRFPHGLTVSNVGLPLSRDVPFPRQRSSATPVTSPVPEFSGVPNSRNRMSDIGRVHSAPPAVRRHHDNRDQTYPSSPPPAYEEVLKQPRLPPPSYDEAQMMQCRQERSVSEDRASHRRGLCHGQHSMPGSRASRSPRGGLSRLPAQDIPDIYWEQAARELDFCTCRKCQARYRHYFENEPENLSPGSTDSMGDAIIPMETQVLMQEIFTDGMAFCSLM